MVFLSENAVFAKIVQEHGLTFIGPNPQHIHMMGDKVIAKQKMRQLKIPTVHGSDSAIPHINAAKKIAAKIGYPVLIKASSGGGGKGMKVAQNDQTLEECFPIAQQEALINFGNADIFLEKYLTNPRHIEIQVLCDQQGNAVHLGERDCSIQRRHQKILEEAPSPSLTTAQRNTLGTMVSTACAKMGYVGVGTFEFLFEDNQFYFIEMNTRIQVEHPVTELITGIDLVKEQLNVAQGAPLNIKQEDIDFKGHAIECRINAENPQTFAPCPGKIAIYHVPGGPGVRVDSALYTGYTIPPFYDSLIAKLIVHGENRSHCLQRLRRALSEFIIEGVQTTLPLHHKLILHKDIINGVYSVHWLEQNLTSL